MSHLIQSLETARLLLRPLDQRDAAFLLTQLNDPAFIRFIGDRGIRTLEQARNYLANGPLRSYEQYGFGLLLVQLKSTQASIGLCGLIQRDYLPDADLGFAFLPAYWHQGYAQEAATAVRDHALNVLHLKRIAAIVQPDNEASIKLLGKLGFSMERIFKLSAVAPEILLLVHRT